MRYGKGQAIMKHMLNISEMVYMNQYLNVGYTLIMDIIPPPVLHLLIVHATTMHKGLHEAMFTILIVFIIMLPCLLININ